jgi:uncharacterized protein YndB with AHSA1/START domain
MGRIDSASLEVSSSPERVFAALLDPDGRERWLPPDVTEVRFVAVDPPHRVVEEVDFDTADPSFAGTMTMTWTVEPTVDGSLVTVTATGVPDGIDARVHEAALASTLANLRSHLVGSHPTA